MITLVPPVGASPPIVTLSVANAPLARLAGVTDTELMVSPPEDVVAKLRMAPLLVPALF